ncbi:MAG: hypothetical protein ACJAXW_004236 [Candidatus Azotimanducaceae bacterium]|jgi:hypothetical protein
MTEFINESEFETLRGNYRSGAISVEMPRQVARQFFLHISPQDVKRTTGKSILFKKTLIWLMNISSPILFIISMALVIKDHGAFEASLIVPIAGICWTVVYGLASDRGGWLIGTVPLVICVVSIMASNLTFMDPIFLFVLSIWLQRTSYLVATRWLLDIVMSSFEAFEMLEEHLSFDSD